MCSEIQVESWHRDINPLTDSKIDLYMQGIEIYIFLKSKEKQIDMSNSQMRIITKSNLPQGNSSFLSSAIHRTVFSLWPIYEKLNEKKLHSFAIFILHRKYLVSSPVKIKLKQARLRNKIEFSHSLPTID